MFKGTATRYIKALDNNTVAIEKIHKDLQVAFLNIKEIRDKTNLGPLSKLDIDQ